MNDVPSLETHLYWHESTDQDPANRWMREQMIEICQQVTAQEANVEDLQRQRDLWQTDEYVEAQARKRLKFVKPGERTYTVIDPSADAPEVDPETGAVKAPSTQPWYEQISSSVAAADDPNSPR